MGADCKQMQVYGVGMQWQLLLITYLCRGVLSIECIVVQEELALLT